MQRNRRRGFTLVEMLIGLVIGTIMLLGLGAVMFLMFRGFNESRDFAEATMRVDLIRSLSFDARTARVIQFPTAIDPTGANAASRGDYSIGGFEGDRVQFVSLRFDSATNTTTPVGVTWQSRRPAGSPAGTPYQIERWTVLVGANNLPLTGHTLTQNYWQNNVSTFEVVRTTNRAFSVDMRTSQGTESAVVQMVVSGRNVIN